MAETTLVDAPAPWRGLTAERYGAMVDAGLLEDAPVELLEGVLAEVSPQGEGHEDVIDVLNEHLVRAVPHPWSVRPQLGLAATPTSVPEPDLAVAVRTRGRRPTTAALVVEVAVSSQRHDLGVKARVYAAAAVTEYWVVDVPRREVVVHARPGPAGYADVRRQPWTAPLRVPVDPPVDIDLAALLERD